jgi:hypothetical protein
LQTSRHVNVFFPAEGWILFEQTTRMTGFYQNKAIMYYRSDAVKSTQVSPTWTQPLHHVDMGWFCLKNSHKDMWKQYHSILIQDPTLMQQFYPVETVQLYYIAGAHFNASILFYGNNTIKYNSHVPWRAHATCWLLCRSWKSMWQLEKSKLLVQQFKGSSLKFCCCYSWQS